jgi:hypothetical protein
MEPVLTVRETVAFFQGKFSARKVYQLFQAGHLQGLRVGQKILIYKSGLEANVRAHETQAPVDESQKAVQRPAKGPRGRLTIPLARLPKD